MGAYWFPFRLCCQITLELKSENTIARRTSDQAASNPAVEGIFPLQIRPIEIMVVQMPTSHAFVNANFPIDT
jgi:hypothetical protein